MESAWRLSSGVWWGKRRKLGDESWKWKEGGNWRVGKEKGCEVRI